jgi:heme exporter protein D
MVSTIVPVAGALTSALGAAFVVVLVAVAVASPFLVLSLVRNVSRTRRALERIADALERGDRPGGGGVLGL